MTYTEFDQQRWVVQPRTSASTQRSQFDRDRARVLHSATFRRLADKTQVVGPGDGDIPRTRLTHSLEVAQISRSIAAALSVNEDLADLAGLCHDLGHPPYGHNGEKALDEIAATCGGYEGNAQTFRILTRLETKVVNAAGDSVGLNLTRAALDAATKYPQVAAEGITKYGAYEVDREAFEWMRTGVTGNGRCIEAQIMDFSDDVAYSVHDVEDGILAGRINMAVLADAEEVQCLAALGERSFHMSAPELIAAAHRLMDRPVVQALVNFEHSFADLIALKDFTSTMVGHFITGIIDHTRAHSDQECRRRHGANLHIPANIESEVTLLKTVALRYVMSDPGHLVIQDRQRDRLHRVAEYLLTSAPQGLDPGMRRLWNQAENDSQRRRVIVDQLASYTESRLERVDKASAGLQAGWG